MQHYHNNQSGRSMVEILGVLAVIGVLSIGGIAAYSKAMEKINIDKTIVDISTTTKKIKNLYADQQSYEGLNKLALESSLVEGVHRITGMNKRLLNRFDGEVFVRSISQNKGFVFVYNGLSQKPASRLPLSTGGAPAADCDILLSALQGWYLLAVFLPILTLASLR